MRLHRLCLAIAALLVLAGATFASTVGAAPTAPSSAGLKAADAPILEEIAEKVPTATEVFVNCPQADAIGIEAEPGEEEPIPTGRGFQCEVRYLLDGEVRKGQDEVEEEPPHSGSYVLVNVSHFWRALPSWQVCAGGEKPRFSEFVRGKVRLRGETCGYRGHRIVEAIEEEALEERGDNFVVSALPATFSVGDEGEDEVGFETERFLCRTTAKAAGRSRIRNVIRCRNPFGDAIEMTLETPLPHKRVY